jgi:cyclohexyl-isocyanide hydratase
MSNSDPLTILFPLYPGVTQLDFTGPYQFLVRLPGVKAIVASVEGKQVTLEGLNFSGLVPLEQIERCDVLCVPGGRGCTDAIRDPRYLSAIRSLAETARYITSVCTGSLILWGSRSSGRKTRSVSLGLAGILASLRRHSRCGPSSPRW